MRLPIFTLTLALLTATAFAADPVAVRTRAWPAEDGGRIMLEFAEPVQHQVRVEGDRLTVGFDRPVTTELLGVMRTLPDLVLHGETAADGRSIGFRLKQPVEVMPFVSSGPLVLKLTREPAPQRPAEAAAAPRVRVRTGEHPGFTRVVFDWPHEVAYDAALTSGGRIAVGFGSPARFEIAAKSRAAHLVSVGRQQDGNAAAMITMPEGGHFEHQRVGPRIVVDLHQPRGPRPQPSVTADAQEAQPPARETAAAAGAPDDPSQPPSWQPVRPPPATAPPAAQAKAEEAPAPARAKRASPPPRETGATLVPSRPATGRGTAAGPTRTAARAPQSEPPPAHEAPAGHPPGPPKRAEATRPPPEPSGATETPPSEPPRTADRKTPPAAAAPATPRPEQAAAVGITREQGRVGIVFPLPPEARAAVFRRGSHVWVVFDRARALDLAALAGAADLVPNVEQLARSDATVIRLESLPGLDPVVLRGATGWTVELRPQAQPPDRRLEAQPEPGAAAGSRIVIPVDSPGVPIELRDPVVGDTLVVVPVAAAQTGFAEVRRFPELQLLATAQGIAAVSMTDQLVVAARPGKVEIGTARGLLMKGGRLDDPPPRERGSFGESRLNLFDFAGWARPGILYRDARARLEQAAAEAEPERLSAARLELARFYLARGHAAEAFGELELIADAAPEMAERPTFGAARGAAALLLDRLPEAEAELGRPALDGEVEAGLWRGLLAARRGEWPEAARKLRSGRRLAERYPAWLREVFAVDAAAAALETGNRSLAEEWLGIADVRQAAEPMRSRLEYMRARLLALQGAEAEAEALYRKIAAGPDRLAGTQAALALVESDLRAANMDRAAAVEALERLRFAWRGDRVELAVLSRLADLYLDEEDWSNGLATLREATTLFAAEPAVAPLRERMTAVFRDLFVLGKADDLPPLKALALYEEFRDLTPPGEEGGTVLRGLAGRLVSLDLFEPASRVLDQAGKRLQGERRAAAAADLALVQLLAKNPEAALAAIDGASAGGQELQARQRYLRARALAELGRTTAAEQALAGDDSRAADAIRADLHWRAGNWAAAGRAYRRLAADPDANSLSAEESSTILKLAIALALSGDRSGALAVGGTYGAAMAETPHQAAFRMVTAAEPAPGDSLRKVAGALSGADDFQKHLKEYRASLEGRGPPPPVSGDPS